MSEYINNTTEHFEALSDFTRGLISGENGKMLIEKYRKTIEDVSPIEAMQVLDKMLLEGFSTETVKPYVGKIINSFFKSLSEYKWENPGEGHFIYYLMLENREVEKVMTKVKSITKVFFKAEDENIPQLAKQLRTLVERLKEYELHYTKKENILFPYIEKAFSEYRCLQLMWSFHDDFRNCIKALEILLQPELPEKDLLNKELGKLFFIVLPIIFREEQIVFPVAVRAIVEKDWIEMLNQSIELGWCYGVTPNINTTLGLMKTTIENQIDLSTGFLNPEQLILLLNNLPVDITFIDKQDEVCYFSGANHRIFPRSKAIIGRKVQNCHPPESVHIVNEIITAFRTGRKDHADFWIQMKGRFIHIRYFALRNELGEYNGTIEVSQDATDVRELQGERRLLDWDN
jgi:DUF438 domain-containing protein